MSNSQHLWRYIFGFVPGSLIAGSLPAWFSKFTEGDCNFKFDGAPGLISDYLSQNGWDTLAKWKSVYQDFQFYIATVLALVGGLYGWYKARTSFQRSARLSEIVFETTGIGVRPSAGNGIKPELFLWISPLKQVQLCDLFSLLYIKSIARGGRRQAKNGETVLKLLTPPQTKAMMLRVRAAIKELSAGSELTASAIPAEPSSPSPYRTERFYGFLRRDSWSDDRYQSFRIILVPKWVVVRTAAEPEWLESVQIDVKHQADRLDHIRFLAQQLPEIEQQQGEMGVIPIDFHFETQRK